MWDCRRSFPHPPTRAQKAECWGAGSWIAGPQVLSSDHLIQQLGSGASALAVLPSCTCALWYTSGDWAVRAMTRVGGGTGSMLVCIKRTCSIQNGTRSKGRDRQLCALSPLLPVAERRLPRGTGEGRSSTWVTCTVRGGLAVALRCLPLDSAASGQWIKAIVKNTAIL